jgi:hypothetical protein
MAWRISSWQDSEMEQWARISFGCMDTDSIFGDRGITLSEPFSIVAPKPKIPPVRKQCRISQEIKPLEEFHLLKHKGRSWRYYACRPCSRTRQRELYRERGEAKSRSR